MKHQMNPFLNRQKIHIIVYMFQPDLDMKFDAHRGKVQ